MTRDSVTSGINGTNGEPGGARADSIDEFLDDLFARLAPFGSAGRRAYLEAEGHLLESVTEARRAGEPRDRAEHTALDRFGPVDAYVSEVGAVTQLRPRELFIRLVANAWLLGAIAASAVGLAGVALTIVRASSGAAVVASDVQGTVFSPQRCAQLFAFYPRAGSCLDASRLHHAQEIVSSYLALGVVGVTALVAYWLAQRGSLGPLTRLARHVQPGVVALGGAAGAVAVAAIELLQGASGVASGSSTGVATTLSLGGAAIAAASVLAPRALVILRS